MNIRVVIADDEELFRVGLAHILARDEEIEIVHQATNGIELLDYMKEVTPLPDVVITDIKMPGLNGVEATKKMSDLYQEVGIIACTTYNTKPFIRNMIDVGASAYLVKNSPPEKVVHYMKEVTPLPDVVITDIKMPGLNGVEATKKMSDLYQEVGIIACTTYNTKPFIRNMIDVGASAYLVKNSPPEKVVHTIKQVFYNGFYYDKQVMDILNKKYAEKNAQDKTVYDQDFLTDREKEVLELICRQYKTSEIAEKLFISPRTVEVHRKNLLQKTEVRNIAGLVIFAIQNELVPPIIIES